MSLVISNNYFAPNQFVRIFCDISKIITIVNAAEAYLL